MHEAIIRNNAAKQYREVYLRAAGAITGDDDAVSDDRVAVLVAVPLPLGRHGVNNSQDAVSELRLPTKS